MLLGLLPDDWEGVAWVLLGAALLLAFAGCGCIQLEESSEFEPQAELTGADLIVVKEPVKHEEKATEVFEVKNTSDGDFSFFVNAYKGEVKETKILVWREWEETVKGEECVVTAVPGEYANGSKRTDYVRECVKTEEVVQREGWLPLEGKVNSSDLIKVELDIQPEYSDGSYGYAVWTSPCVDDKCNYEASWFNASFDSRINCTVDTKVASNLTDFPVACELPNRLLDEQCWGLRAVNADDDAALDYEVEGGTCQTGEDAVVWVKLPTAYETSYSSLNTIRLYYDNTTDVGDASNGSAVFSNNYSAVWHMGDANDSVTQDATGDNWFNWSGGGSQNVTHLDCRHGNCTRFNNTVWGDVNNLNTNYPKTADTGVLSVWVHAYDSDWNYILCNSDVTNVNFGNGLFLRPDEWIYSHKVGALSGGRQNSTQSLVEYDTTRYYTIQADGSNSVMLGLNGTQVPTTNFYQDSAANYYDLGNEWKIGTFFRSGTSPPSVALNGVIDEMRLHDVNRSEDWLVAEYSTETEVTHSFWVDGEPEEPANETEFEGGATIGLKGQCYTEGTLTGATAWVFDALNASLVEAITNTSAVSNATSYNWTYTAPSSYDGSFEWFIECEAVDSGFDGSANTSLLNFTSRQPPSGSLAYYQADTQAFEYNCTGLSSLNVVTEPDNQTDSLPIMVFNNTGSVEAALSLAVNYSPYGLEFYAGQNNSFGNASRVYATQNTTINSSVPAGEDVLLWWWVNCSNVSVSGSPTDIYTSFEWWFER